MTRRWLTLVSLVLLLGAVDVGCGNYGPPVRVNSKVESPKPVQQTKESAPQSADNSEEESDLKEKKP